ncbi:ArsA-related P-loop ATPase [Rudaeicoccus suwonensis]|uniref:Arsenite efflux ATP-binding protein ArsA n=1 Tax=Rudaeicoccus suwonensis TaxID=657409 RepID=A0A561E347_9MICO|nr:ArsA-related P-loop ATPase [Rudaeicoccus suwonensis]TWE10024.1 arsenite efflux ATP-binding protein ArsA [Rudaeicoccus suwonensis]
MASDFDGVRLHIVTGKGGTGKTTVAAALAMALAAEGKRVLIAEVEGRQGISGVFDVPRLGEDEVQVASAADNGVVMGLAVDAKAALLEYLQMFYKLGIAGGMLERFGVVDFATTVAPGLRDVLLIGKVYEAVRRRPARRGLRHHQPYDAVVLDAPPTGRIGHFLGVNNAVAGLAKVGPVKNQADSITQLLQSAQTRVHLVTLLEEMPVQETVDAVAELRHLSLPLGAVVINQERPPQLHEQARALLAADTFDTSALQDDLGALGLRVGPTMVNGLTQSGRDLISRLDLEQRERETITDLGLATYHLPLLPDALDSGGLLQLATELAEQGAAV